MSDVAREHVEITPDEPVVSLHDVEIARLASRFREGDRESFAELFQLVGPKVIATVMSYSVGKDQVRDVVQETFRKAWQRRETLKHPDRFVGWIRAIARRECLPFLREQKEVPVAPVVIESALSRSSAPDPTDLVDALDEWENASKILSPVEKRIVYAHHGEGLTDPEIGEELGMTAAAVKQRRRRAVDKIRGRFGGDNDAAA